MQHVTPHGLYPVPLLLKNGNATQYSQIPRDFAFCNLASRPPGPIVSGAGIPPGEVMKMRHAGIQKLAGVDAETLPVSLQSTDIEGGESVFVTLCDKYYDYVKSKEIIPVRGRLSELVFKQAPDGGQALVLEDGTQIPDVTAVVLATGFESTPAASVLDEKSLEKLAFDRDCPRIPFKLSEFQTSNPSIPSLGFVGMFEGLHWGVVEMQARIVADKWFANDDRPSPHLETSFEESSKMDELRRLLKVRIKGAPQYWFSDHGGYMEEIAAALNLPRMDDEEVHLAKTFGPREGPAIPARYLTPSTDEKMSTARQEAQKTMNSMYAYLYRRAL